MRLTSGGQKIVARGLGMPTRPNNANLVPLSGHVSDYA
jgi:hypothetical protein